MASLALSRRVDKVVGYSPLCDIGADRRREFHSAAQGRHLQDLPGKWQAAILSAEQTRPKLRVAVSG